MPPITLRDVRRAITRGELDLVYQPEVDLRTGHIAAVEALVRWHRPGVGLVLPPQFIPLAERNGQIRELTMIVFRRALAQAALWKATRWDGAALPIWVNLSACELSDPKLQDRIIRLLGEYDVAPSQLGLEITETAPMTDVALATSTLYALHERGVRIAIDDFGTGYSSLSHLKHLPIDVVKIDRRFVDGIAYDEGDAAIVMGIIGIAHTLGVVVAAEGIEEPIQQHTLVAMGCDLGQGYLLSSPQIAATIETLLGADRERAGQAATRRRLPVRVPRPRNHEVASPLEQRA